MNNKISKYKNNCNKTFMKTNKMFWYGNTIENDPNILTRNRITTCFVKIFFNIKICFPICLLESDGTYFRTEKRRFRCKRILRCKYDKEAKNNGTRTCLHAYIRESIVFDIFFLFWPQILLCEYMGKKCIQIYIITYRDPNPIKIIISLSIISMEINTLRSNIVFNDVIILSIHFSANYLKSMRLLLTLGF